MSDYISRDAAKKVFQEKCSECEDACMEFDGFMPDCSQCLMNGAAKSIINEIPAADVRPVVKGKWVRRTFASTERGGWKKKVFYCCSNCETTWDAPTNFCPNCGAEMKEGEA